MRLVKSIAILASISLPWNAAAQTDAPVKNFRTLVVTDGSGGETQDKLPAKSFRFKIPPQRNRVLQSKSGAIKGAIIGGGIGAVLGPTIGAESCPENKKHQCVLKAGVTLGAVGALIGWLK